MKIDECLRILGLTRGASVSDIVLAYRKLAFKFHPDRKGGSEAKFKEMKAAYDWLEANYERTLELEKAAAASSIKKVAPEEVIWSSFSNTPNPNIPKYSNSTPNFKKQPYVYPSHLPKWNVSSALDNDWEVKRYEQSGELDRQMVGNFSDWNKAKDKDTKSSKK